MLRENGWTTPPEEHASHPHGNGRLGIPRLRPTGLKLSREDRTTIGTIPFPQMRTHTIPQTNTHGTPADRKARPPHMFLSHAQIGPGPPNHEICQQPKNQRTERSIHQSKKPGSLQERQFTSCSKDQPTRDHKSPRVWSASKANQCGSQQPGPSGSRPMQMQCASTPALDQDHGELSPPTRSSVSCQKIFSNCSERTKEKGSTSQTSHTYR